MPSIPDTIRPRFPIRWLICALLFLATEINYIDRQVIALLKGTLTDIFQWSETDYGNIIFSFQAAYAAGLLLAGGIIDKIGVKKGYLIAVLIWSLAAALHGIAAIPALFTWSVVVFSAARIALGLAEAANFPAAIKATAEWFPKKERALATGIFNAGSNIGALTAPYLVPRIAVNWGWPAAFLVTGAIGILWVILWQALYHSPESHPKLSAEERAYILSDSAPEPTQKISWLILLKHRQTLAFALAKFLTDPFWWFYLFWVPGFLEKNHHVKITELFLPLLTIYGFSSVGSVAGGYLSSTLIRRGFSINFARKTALLTCALCVVPIFLAAQMDALWPTVLLIALAAAAHQGFSANLFTLASDTIPKKTLSSVVGIGGAAGAIGGMLIAKFTGFILDLTHSYAISFALPSLSYLLAVLVIHVLLPKLESMKLPNAVPAH